VNRARASRPTQKTRALLLRRVELGESDLVLTVFTESIGRIAVLARGARKSQKRFGGALEPFHTMRLEADEPLTGDLYLLRETVLETTRLVLTMDLARMDAAGRALGWVRTAAPPRVAEPAVWQALSTLLDRLDDPSLSANPRLMLAEQGLKLLGAFGWGLDLEQCVKCGKPCSKGRAALVDPLRGGLVCRACGGAPIRLSGAARDRMAGGALVTEDVDAALNIVERALEAHAGTK
jgi:DNA repair protein RecO (recombination protein O)